MTSIPLAVAFTKHLGHIFLPSKDQNREQQPTPSESTDWSESCDVRILTTVREKFRKLLDAFYEALSRRAIKEHTVRFAFLLCTLTPTGSLTERIWSRYQHMLETDRRNHDAYIRSGEIFEDRAQNYEKMARSWEKLWSGMQGWVRFPRSNRSARLTFSFRSN